MSNDILQSKIELIEEQIENLERSGYYTEKEIDRLSFPIREELEQMKIQFANSYVDEFGEKYGISPEERIEGNRIHNELWAKIKEAKNQIIDIKVNGFEVLAPDTEVILIDDQKKHFSLGLTAEEMIEGCRRFSELLTDEFRIPISTYHIEVIDAEILTPNHITA